MFNRKAHIKLPDYWPNTKLKKKKVSKNCGGGISSILKSTDNYYRVMRFRKGEVFKVFPCQVGWLYSDKCYCIANAISILRD